MIDFHAYRVKLKNGQEFSGISLNLMPEQIRELILDGVLKLTFDDPLSVNEITISKFDMKKTMKPHDDATTTSNL